MSGRSIVIALAILVASVVVYYAIFVLFTLTSTSSRPDAALSEKDHRRMRDAHDLQQALAAYFKDHDAYPPTPTGTACGSVYNNLPELSGALAPYIKQIPRDPGPDSCAYNYFYLSSEKSFVVMIHLDGIDSSKYKDRWCIGVSAGTMPDVMSTYRPCP